MEVETREIKEGTEIVVDTERKVAVAVQSSEGERIYLPEVEGDDSSYYVEEPETLAKTPEGWKVVHPGEIEDVEVIG